jgi:methionyl-tRNA formyltransferase
VFCAPDKPGAKPDALRVDAESLGLPVFTFASLRSPEAEQAMRSLDADLGIMAYVLQFAPQEFVNIPRTAPSSSIPRCCRCTAGRRPSAGRSRWARPRPA